MLSSTRPQSGLAELLDSLRVLEHRITDGDTPRLEHLLASSPTRLSPLPSVLLALPFLTPVSMGPLTAPCSIIILWYGVGMARGVPGRRLPRRILDIKIPTAVIRGMRVGLDRTQRMISKITQRRLSGLVDDRPGQVICGLGMAAGAALLAIPIPLLPFTNTLPALGIIAFGLGWSERDGGLTIAGVLSILSSALLFGMIGAGLWLGSREVVGG